MRSWLKGLLHHLDPNHLGFWQMLARYTVGMAFVLLALFFLLILVQGFSSLAGHPLLP